MLLYYTFSDDVFPVFVCLHTLPPLLVVLIFPACLLVTMFFGILQETLNLTSFAQFFQIHFAAVDILVVTL